MTGQRHPSSPDSGARRIWCLNAVMSLGALVVTCQLSFPTFSVDVVVWATVIAASFFAVEAWAISIRLSGQRSGLTLSEVPLIIGLFTLNPVLLVVARLVGVSLCLRCVRKQETYKVAYNAIAMWWETLISLGVLWVVNPSDALDGVRTTTVVVCIALVSTLLSNTAVSLAQSVYLGTPQVTLPMAVMTQSLGPNTATSAFAILTLAAVQSSGWLLWAPAVIVLVMYLAYRSHIDLIHLHERLNQVLGFTSRTSGGNGKDAVLAEALEATQALGGVLGASVVLLDDAQNPIRVTGSLSTEEVAAVLVEQADNRPSLDSQTDTQCWPLGEQDRTHLIARFNQSDSSTADLNKTIDQIVNHTTIALKNASQSEALKAQAADAARRALIDPLTGLPNRTALLRGIADALAAGRPFATLLMDLNNFKEVNDALGHAAGDQVLVEVSSRLAPLADGTLLISRMGGDEFAMLVEGDESHARMCAERLLTEVRRPVQAGSYRLQIDGSIGIALCPEHGRGADELIKHADLAMYAAKATGGHVMVFGADAGGRAVRQLEVSTRFRDALQQRRISAMYQPQISLCTGQLTGVEALARWEDPVLGTVRPEEFVKVAEQAGLMQELTELMLDDALRWHQRWLIDGQEIPVSVNLSAKSLLDLDLPGRVQSRLRARGIDPAQLTLEITESSFMSDPHRSLIVLDSLAEIGVRLSIDDFGTGYSSLAYLQKLPVNEVKVDKSFVLAMNAETDTGSRLVGGILRLCHELGFEVVAEGIESAQVQSLLRAMECERGQGFHIARPLTPESVVEWNDERTGVARVAALN